MKEYKYKVGLVLSGGGARGFAHIGALKALNEAGIYPDVISGVSAGAIIGAFYADGYDNKDIFKLFSGKGKKYWELTIPKRGLLKSTKLARVLKENLRAKTFEDLKTKFYVTVTNMTHGKTMYMDTGDLARTVLASSSIPIFFPPIEINGVICSDGGVMNNLPLKPLMGYCEKIIAIHVNPLNGKAKLDSLMSIAERAFHLAINKNVKYKKPYCDIFISPEGLHNYGLFDTSKGRKIFNIGYEETKKMLETIYIEEYLPDKSIEE